MNKKAQVFVPMVTFMTLVILIIALTVLSTKYNVKDSDNKPRVLGYKQAELFGVYQKGENALFYISQSARVSSNNAIVSLTKNESGCGTYLDYSVWSNKDKKCEPNEERMQKKFELLFKNELNKFLFNYDATALLTDSYDFSINKEKDYLKLFGNARNPLVISFGGVPKLSAEQIDEILSSKDSPLEGLGQCFVEAEAKSGIPSLVILAVTAIESDYGNSGLSGEKCSQDKENLGPSNNLFSQKGNTGTAGFCNWETRECLTPEQEKEESVVSCNVAKKQFKCDLQGKKECTVKAQFKAYKNKCDSINDFVNLIKQPRYWEGEGNSQNPSCNPVKDSLTNPTELIKNIQECGYATDPEWANKIVAELSSLIEENQGKISEGSGVYKIKSDFKTKINFSFSEFELVNISLQKISEQIALNCYKSGTNTENCISDILKDNKDFKWSLERTKGKDEKEEKEEKMMIRVCAESKYSFFNALGEKQPFVYKIAFFAGDTVAPSPVQGLLVADTKNAEENITVSFNANLEPDMNYYNIYYSENQFSTISEGVKFLKRINHISSKSYSNTINITNDGTFFVAVTPVDTSGNENKDVVSQKVESIDDLNPGPVGKLSFEKPLGKAPIYTLVINPPLFNEDGSEIKDLESYLIYLRETVAECSKEDIFSVLNNPVKKESINIDKTKSQEQFTAKLELPDPAKKYCLVVIAGDEIAETDVKDTQYNENSIISIP